MLASVLVIRGNREPVFVFPRALLVVVGRMDDKPATFMRTSPREACFCPFAKRGRPHREFGRLVPPVVGSIGSSITGYRLVAV